MPYPPLYDTSNLTPSGFTTQDDDDRRVVRLARLTSAQIAAPTAQMLSNRTDLFVGPDDVRYYSNGAALVAIGSGSGSGGGGGSAANAIPASDILPVVGAITSLVPAASAEEYVSNTGEYSFTDGAMTWGGHQSTFVRMSDGTCFAAVQNVANLLVRRSATGGAYGVAWTTVATIADSTRATVDLDAHLLRNPVTDQVHLITSDTNNRIRVRTWSSAGTLVSDILVPDIYPGYDATKNYYRDGATVGTAYSSASIGADGTIALCRAVTSTPPAEYVPNMVAGLHVQTLKYDGATWKYSGARLLNVGPRLAYNRLWVSPPGNEGYIVGLGTVDVTWKEWTQAKNPNYNGTWANTIASNTFMGGRVPEFRLFKIPLATLNSISITTVLGPNYRTVDISAASPPSVEFGAYSLQSCTMDRQGRIWITYDGNTDFTTNKRSMRVLDPNGAALYTYDNPGVNTAGQIVGHHEDLTGKMWLLWTRNLPTMENKIIPVTESGGALIFQDLSVATNLNTGAWGSNLTTPRYEGFAANPKLFDERCGSVRTHNWIEFLAISLPDHTGTAPGTVIGVAASGSMKAKRVRIQLPI